MARKRVPNGSGSQPRLRKDGRWEAKVSAGYDPRTGKEIRKSVYAHTCEECSRKLRDAVAKIDSDTYIAPTSQTVAEWAEAWLADFNMSVKPSTLKSYSDIVHNHIIPSLGRRKLTDLQPLDVQKFVNCLTRQKGLSPKTCKNVHGCLSKMLTEAVRMRIIPSNPATGTHLPRRQQVDIHPLDDDGITTFLKAASEDKFYHLFFFMVYTGCRIGEALGLTWRQIDFKESRITIDQQMLTNRGKGSKREIGPTKNSKSRSFIAPPAVMDCLKQAQYHQKELRLRAGSLWDNPLGLCFTDEQGHELVQITVERHYKQILAGAGLPPHRLHDLRHTAITQLIALGVATRTVSDMVGHSDPGFTLRVYTHRTTAMEEDAARRLQAAIIARG